MDDSKPQLPKFKLVERESADSTASSESQSAKTSSAASQDKPLALRKTKETYNDSEIWLGTDDILESAYGAEKRASQRRRRLKALKGFCLRVALVCVFFGGTLIYAHRFAGIPVLEPASWYSPFFLSAALSAWLSLQAARLWDQAYQLLALFGFALAGALIFWNLHVMAYAAGNPRDDPGSRLSVPESVPDLFYTGEFDALRGIPMSKSAYARISSEDYRRAFYALPRDQWRSHFQRYLSGSELEDINSTNIDEKMHQVARRLAAAREKSLDEMGTRLENPSFKLQIQQALVRPYTWLIGFM